MSTTVTEVAQSTASLALKPSQEAEAPVEAETYRYAHLLPVLDQEHFPPWTDFEHDEPGLRALTHPNPRAFLDNATVEDLTPEMGSVVHGVNLATLDNTAKDQLSLEVAKRRLMVFRDQEDFIDRGPAFYRQWGTYFGPLHIHPTSLHPRDYPDVHLVYRDAKTNYNFEIFNSTTTTNWHSDVSYEKQPPGLSAFFLLSQPKTGGDTIFASQVAALKKLSPPFVAFLRTLKAVHSGVKQAEHSRSGLRGGVVRRDPVETVHPLVRRHPVTGEEALYINKDLTLRIVGLKNEESDTILKFLYDHVSRSADIQVRVKWEPNTIVVWDNRITAHSVIIDYLHFNERRHGARIMSRAERPIPALDGLDLSA